MCLPWNRVRDVKTNQPSSLPGAVKKSFSLPYAGGEIWFEHLDSLYRYTDLAIQKLTDDRARFQKPTAPSSVGVVLFETAVSKELVRCLAESFLCTEKHFLRVAFLGADFPTRLRLKRELNGKGGFAIAFFDDVDMAKQWLVQERA